MKDRRKKELKCASCDRPIAQGFVCSVRCRLDYNRKHVQELDRFLFSRLGKTVMAGALVVLGFCALQAQSPPSLPERPEFPKVVAASNVTTNPVASVVDKMQAHYGRSGAEVFPRTNEFTIHYWVVSNSFYLVTYQQTTNTLPINSIVLRRFSVTTQEIIQTVTNKTSVTKEQ